MTSCDKIGNTIDTLAAQVTRMASEVQSLKIQINAVRASKADRAIENRVSALSQNVGQLHGMIIPLPADIRENRRTSRRNSRTTRRNWQGVARNRGKISGNFGKIQQVRSRVSIADRRARRAGRAAASAGRKAAQAARKAALNASKILRVGGTARRALGRAGRALSRIGGLAGRIASLAGMLFQVLAIVGIVAFLMQQINNVRQDLTRLFGMAMQVAGRADSRSEENANRISNLTHDVRRTRNRLYEIGGTLNDHEEKIRSNRNYAESNFRWIQWIIARLGGRTEGATTNVTNIFQEGDVRQTINNIVNQNVRNVYNQRHIQQVTEETVNNYIKNVVNEGGINLTGGMPDLSGLERKIRRNSQNIAANAAKIGVLAAGIAALWAAIRGIQNRLNQIPNRLGNMPRLRCRFNDVQATRAANTAATTNVFLTGTMFAWLTTKWTALTQILGTAILPGGLVGAFTRFAKSSIVTRAINALSLLATLHNAAMLSRNLVSTLGEVLSQGLFVVGIRDENDTPIDISGVLGTTTDNFFASILDEENWTSTKESFARANRIYQSAANIVYTTRGLFDSTQEILEWTGETLAKIGNGLKLDGIVNKLTWPWFPTKVNPQSRVIRKLQALEDAADSLSVVTSELVEIQQEAAELGQQVVDFENLIRDSEPGEDVDNEPIKQQAEDAQNISESAPILESDLHSGG